MEIKSQLIINRLRFFISILHHICTTHNINIRFHTPATNAKFRSSISFNPTKRNFEPMIPLYIQKASRASNSKPSRPD